MVVQVDHNRLVTAVVLVEVVVSGAYAISATSSHVRGSIRAALLIGLPCYLLFYPRQFVRIGIPRIDSMVLVDGVGFHSRRNLNQDLGSHPLGLHRHHLYAWRTLLGWMTGRGKGIVVCCPILCS